MYKQINIYTRFLFNFARSELHNSRGWLQSAEDVGEEYYNQLIYY